MSNLHEDAIRAIAISLDCLTTRASTLEAKQSTNETRVSLVEADNRNLRAEVEHLRNEMRGGAGQSLSRQGANNSGESHLQPMSSAPQHSSARSFVPSNDMNRECNEEPSLRQASSIEVTDARSVFGRETDAAPVQDTSVNRAGETSNHGGDRTGKGQVKHGGVSGSRLGGNGQSSNTNAGVKKNKSKKQVWKPKHARPPIEPVVIPEMEKRVYTNEQGKSMIQMVNTSVPGGSSLHKLASNPNGGFWGGGNDQTDLNVPKKLVMADPDNVGYTFEINPVKRDAMKFFQPDGVRMRSFASTGRTKDGQVAALEYRPVTEISEEPRQKCVLCGSKGHKLAGHLRASKGEVSGCILCNQMTHWIDNCSQFTAMTMTEKIDLLVTSRANMPAVKTQIPWHELLWHYLQSEEFKSEGAKVPNGFPWSKSFGTERTYEDNGKAIAALQLKYDSAGNKDSLPPCPSTSSLEEVFKFYWQPAGRIWPGRLDDLPRARHFGLSENMADRMKAAGAVFDPLDGEQDEEGYMVLLRG
ncbi:hypothetical protein ACHAPJ_011271 [Fusarium lateritium]